MVGRKLQGFGRDKEEDIVMLPLDLDIGFISCLDIIHRAFMVGVKRMAMESCGSRVI